MSEETEVSIVQGIVRLTIKPGIGDTVITHDLYAEEAENLANELRKAAYDIQRTEIEGND